MNAAWHFSTNYEVWPTGTRNQQWPMKRLLDTSDCNLYMSRLSPGLPITTITNKDQEILYKFNTYEEFKHINAYRVLFTFCFSSSERASILTFAHGNSFGHHGGRVDSRPHPGFPLPVEYFSINGINARSWAWVIFSTGVGIPSMIRGGNS